VNNISTNKRYVEYPLHCGCGGCGGRGGNWNVPVPKGMRRPLGVVGVPGFEVVAGIVGDEASRGDVL